MTWLDVLATELAARRVPARQRARILLELRDHIASEPGCEDRLGDPRGLAASFADELATARARGCAFGSFGALTLTALALIVSQLAIGHAGGHPGFTNGISLALFVPALLGMFVAPQIALVAGTLAALRAARRRGQPRLPAAEIGLIGRRARVALLAGFGTVAGLALYLTDFSQRLPAWYLGLVGGLGAVAAAALYLALRSLRQAQTIVSRSPGAAGDVYDDLPVIGWSWLRRRPWRLGAVGTLIVAVAMTLFFAHAEHSLAEGLQRGIVEALAVAAGFALLGRTVGLLPAHSEAAVALSGQLATEAGLTADPHDQLAGDDDRSRAELILRESFAQGRLSLDELTARVSAVHEAETVGELRGALAGLPPRP